MSPDPIQERNRAAGMFLLRVLLGLIFFWQGFGKVFEIGVGNLYDMAFASYEDTFLPDFLLHGTAWYTSLAELLAGACLILGLFREYAYYMLGSVLLIVAFGHGLDKPIWDLSHVLFRTALLVPLLLLPRIWDRWTVMALFQGKD